MPRAVKQLLGDQTVPAGCSPPEFAAWYAVATALLEPGRDDHQGLVTAHALA